MVTDGRVVDLACLGSSPALVGVVDEEPLQVLGGPGELGDLVALPLGDAGLPRLGAGLDVVDVGAPLGVAAAGPLGATAVGDAPPGDAGDGGRAGPLVLGERVEVDGGLGRAEVLEEGGGVVALGVVGPEVGERGLQFLQGERLVVDGELGGDGRDGVGVGGHRVLLGRGVQGCERHPNRGGG